MFKKFFIVLSVLGMFVFSGLTAMAAEKVGYVDMNKVLKNYSKAQKLSNDFKGEQKQLQGMVTDAKQQLAAAKSKQEKQQLEKKLSAQLKKKSTAMKNKYSKRIGNLQSEIDNAIAKVAKSKDIDTVVTQDEVVKGGQNITDEVLKTLNK